MSEDRDELLGTPEEEEELDEEDILEGEPGDGFDEEDFGSDDSLE